MAEPIFHAFQELPDETHVVTIGSFDGVHRGHQYLLQKVVDHARSLSASSLVVTFDPLPAEVLRPDKAPSRLCSTEERIRELLNAGIDHVLVLPFSVELSQLTADDFLSLLINHARPASIIIGADFAFGYHRHGTPEFLAGRSEQFGYQLTVVERVNPEGLELSSSSVRRALTEAGDVETARKILGRNFQLTGDVRNGDHRGRSLGYPTANLQIPDRLTLPADGIYAGVAEFGAQNGDVERPALIYVGSRPTFDGDQRIVEVFLLDFNGDLYGESLNASFIRRIRGDRQFASAEELVEQMKLDEVEGRRLLGELGITSS